jgi:imidazolonepropionase-like amidohydrolase
MVRALVERGVNCIKIFATERAGLPQTDPRKRVFSDEELAAAVDEATKLGVPVAAHAHGDGGAAAAVRAGVRSIEHGTYLSDATLAAMKDRGTFLVPTLSFTTGYAISGGPERNPAVMARSRAMAPRLRETTSRASRLGIKIVAGSDGRYDDERRLQDELAELVDNGCRPIDAIKAATSVAAECLMIGERVGAVKAGMEADLIAVSGNPLEDINAMRDVILVINNGHIAVNRLRF